MNELNDTMERVTGKVLKLKTDRDALLAACKVALECAETNNPNGWRSRLAAAIEQAEKP